LPLRELREILRHKGELSGALLLADVGHVLKHIFTIWKNPVVLKTSYDGASLVIRCDRDARISVELDGRSGRLS